jgi:hypothetical protein
MVVQGFSNKHNGELPPSDRTFLEWAASRDPEFGTQRYWPPGSRDVKSDGTVDPPPWDWNPLGCPGGNGCNDGDWMNHAPWAASAVAIVPGGGPQPAAPGTSSGGQQVLPAAGGGGIPSKVAIPGVGQVDTVVLAAAGLGVALLVMSRR